MFAPAGAVPGLIYGAGTGALTGAIGAGLNGNNILKGAAYGASFGGVAGGVSGYIKGDALGINPWTGSGTSVHALNINISAVTYGEQYASDEEMRNAYNNSIGKIDNLTLEQAEDITNSYVSIGNSKILKSNGYSMDESGFFQNRSNGRYAAGITTGYWKNGWSSGSSIYMAPGLKARSLEYQNMAFKHEFMHAWHWTQNPNPIYMARFSERATSAFSLSYSKTYGFGSQIIDTHRTNFFEAGGLISYPSSYSWQKFSEIIPTWLKAR